MVSAEINLLLEYLAFLEENNQVVRQQKRNAVTRKYILGHKNTR